MKVLHVIYTMGISGAEKYLMDLLPGLQQQGVECELMLVSPGKLTEQLAAYCQRMEALGIRTTRLSANRPGFFFAARKISRYLKRNGIRIVHSHLFNTDLLVTLVKRFFFPRLYIISTKHGYSEKVLMQYTGDGRRFPHDLYYRLTRYTLGAINCNLSISGGISRLYADLGFTRESYPVIPHGINIQPFPQKTGEMPYRRSPVQLIIVGRLETFKGHRFLIDALPDVCASFPDCKLLVLGEGSARTALEQQVSKLGIQERVEFLGFREDPYSYMVNSDVIIMPSSFEPFGLVFIESFALQVPVVAFDAPAGNEIIVHGETGVLVPRNDSASLGAAIIRLLRHPEERARLAANAYQRYLDFYNTKRMCADTAECYRGLDIP